MKVATLDLTPDLFIEFSKACKDGIPRRFVVKENPLPDDSRIVQAVPRSDCFPTVWRLFIVSESFDEIPDGTVPPALPPILFETIYEDEPTPSLTPPDAGHSLHA